MTTTRASGTIIERPAVRHNRSMIVPFHWCHAHAREPEYCDDGRPSMVRERSMTDSISLRSSTLSGRPRCIASSYVTGPCDDERYFSASIFN